MRNGFTRGLLVTMGAVLLAHCDVVDMSSVAPPVIATVSLVLADSTIEAGRITSATATGRDERGRPLSNAVEYSSSDQLVAAIDPHSGVIFAIASGSARISARVGTATELRTLTVLRAPIVLNEIKPDGAASTGFVELYNNTSNDVDISNWRLTASDVFQGFTVPAGTVLLAGHYRVVNEVSFPLGLKAADAVHLFSPAGILVETFRWLTEPVLSYGRCPDGNGPFADMAAITRGGVNLCADYGT